MRRVAIVCTQQKQKENESLRVAAAAAAASETGSTLPSSLRKPHFTRSTHKAGQPAKEREKRNA
jgi:hypothetical protein